MVTHHFRTVPHQPAHTLCVAGWLEEFKPSAPFLTPNPTPWARWGSYEQDCATDPMPLKTAHSADPVLLTTFFRKKFYSSDFY